MMLTMLKGKIHRATVKQAEVDYIGSITIDSELMEAAGILEYEKVIIMCYAQVDEREAAQMKPRVVFVDEDNKASRITRYEKHGRLEDLQ